MKQLLIVRHAKSDWSSPTFTDFDRTLNTRGNADAPAMAQRLLNKQIQIDAFVSSTAVRAFTTASYFAQAYGKLQTDIIGVSKLYNATVDAFYNVVEGLSNEFNSVALFSHNPGITEFVNELTKTKIDEMPTCGIFCVRIDINDWKEFEKAKKHFQFFDYPKAL